MNKRQLQAEEQIILDACIEFLAQLQKKIDKRNKPNFEYMVSDAKKLSIFFHDLKEELRLIRKNTRQQKRKENAV